MVHPSDAKIERNLEREGLKEVQELEEAWHILEQIRTPVGSEIRNIETAARLVLTARSHNKNLAALSKRLWGDLMSFRGGGKADKFLTSNEMKVLSTTLSITPHLDNIVSNLEFAVVLYKRHQVGSGYDKIRDVMNELHSVISTIKELFIIERQLDAALAR